eukprot:TRINITY_DN20233_c0_g1_i1.p1 TRINITY_DN20233_c0_g1~~TRINITY_DN20233_c0_g1_i1.p1  ORF type:complete len:208 (-),score=6.54 TRINITY_DN20233_c0_g1_i1:195-818(-)
MPPAGTHSKLLVFTETDAPQSTVQHCCDNVISTHAVMTLTWFEHCASSMCTTWKPLQLPCVQQPMTDHAMPCGAAGGLTALVPAALHAHAQTQRCCSGRAGQPQEGARVWITIGKSAPLSLHSDAVAVDLQRCCSAIVAPPRSSGRACVPTALTVAKLSSAGTVSGCPCCTGASALATSCCRRLQGPLVVACRRCCWRVSIGRFVPH